MSLFCLSSDIQPLNLPIQLTSAFPSLPFALLCSLLLTLILEAIFTLLWGEPKSVLPAVLLVNCITNPIVVLLHRLALQQLPSLVNTTTVLLETAAVLAEGWYYARRTSIRHPWGFSLCANLFSYFSGLLLNVFLSIWG